MRSTAFRVLLVALVFCCGAGAARAQLRIGLDIERFTYLLYEPINLDITIENQAGFDMVFQDDKDNGGKPWLTFFITRPDHSLVLPDRKIPGKELKLAAGEHVLLHADLTPLYKMRETGNYKIQAVVDVAGREFLSAPIQLTLVNGQRIWSETRPVDGSSRTYSLIRFAPTMKGTFLYLRVEDEAENLVYANNLLGEIVDLGPPQVAFDNRGQVHILQLAGSATYRYTRADANGELVSQSAYDSVNESQPRLARQQDGGVLVAGGRQENDANRRERLSAAQSRVTRAEAPQPVGPFAPMAAGAAPTGPGPSAPGGSPPPPRSGSTN